MAVSYQGGNDSVITGAFAPLLQIMQQNRQFAIKTKADQQKASDKINDEVSRDLSKIERNGLRQADLEDFNKKYQALKGAYFDLERTTDPSEKRVKRMQINSSLGELNGYVTNSRKLAEREYQALQQVSSLVGKGRPEEYREHLKGLSNMKTSEVTPEMLEKSSFLDQFDSAKVDKAIKALAPALLKNPDIRKVKSEILSTDKSSKGKVVDNVQTSLVVGDDDIFKAISQEYARNRDVKGYVDKLMLDNGITDLNKGISMVVEAYRPNFSSANISRESAEKGKMSINVNSTFGTKKEQERAIEDDAELFTFKDGVYKAKSHMPLNKTQSLSGVIKGKNPYDGQDVSFDNPKNAEIFGVFTNAKGKKMLMIRITDEYEIEHVIVSPNIKRLNRAELSSKELKYLQGFEDEADKQQVEYGKEQKAKTDKKSR